MLSIQIAYGVGRIQWIPKDNMAFSWCIEMMVQLLRWMRAPSLGIPLTFYINGHLATPLGPGELVWTANGDVIELNLESHSGQAGLSPGERSVPEAYSLSQNYPNPFNPVTRLRYQLPETGNVSLNVFNVFGQQVRTLVNTRMEAGYHSVYWDGRNDRGEKVTSGVYFSRMKAGKFVKTRKMIILR